MATTSDHSTQIQKMPFVRELASSDRKTRDKALESLTLFLRARRDLSLLELLKIWKGLFFCFYHSDRPLTQQALARALSYSLVPSLPRESRLRFLRAFWITIGREFHALDRLRLDKYLFLIRCYVGVAFEVFLKGRIANGAEDGPTTTEGKKKKRKRGGNGDGDESKKKRRKNQEEEEDEDDDDAEEQSQTNDSDDEKWTELGSYLSLLEDGPLCPLNFDPDHSGKKKEKNKKSQEESTPMPHGPDGLRYHIIDIWLDELAKVIDPEDAVEKKDDGSSAEAERSTLKDRYDIPMDLLLRPFEKLKAESPTKSVRQRAKNEVLDDERLIEWGFRTRPVEEEDEEEEEEEWGGFAE